MNISKALQVNNIVNRSFELYLVTVAHSFAHYDDAELVQFIDDEYKLWLVSQVQPVKTRKVYLVTRDSKVCEFSMGLTGAYVRYAFTSKPAAMAKAGDVGEVILFNTTVTGSIQDESIQEQILREYLASK